ncbi:MAG: chorismate mutase [Solirubrobacteraceae bacterium]
MNTPGRETSPATGLEPFRRCLDRLDGEIAGRLGERFAICREIALYKREHDIPMMQPDRVAEVRSRYLARGAEVQLPADFTADLFELLISATCRMEDELIAAQTSTAQNGDLARDPLEEEEQALGEAQAQALREGTQP